jgi:hypothetical protein
MTGAQVLLTGPLAERCSWKTGTRDIDRSINDQSGNLKFKKKKNPRNLGASNALNIRSVTCSYMKLVSRIASLRSAR